MGPNHPIWALIRLTILMTTLTVVLYINASHFDETEWRSIVAMLLAGLGIESFQTMVGRRDS